MYFPFLYELEVQDNLCIYLPRPFNRHTNTFFWKVYICMYVCIYTVYIYIIIYLLFNTAVIFFFKHNFITKKGDTLKR